ncbi:MAG TPA: hypothetical protein VK204_09970 [Nocardioidaceae bacterium]|nr:hypothetical protein [Nocardioidaceae bacterium]
MVSGVTHLLRLQDAAPSLRLYKQEIRHPLDAEVVGLVVDWAARVTGEARTTIDAR